MSNSATLERVEKLQVPDSLPFVSRHASPEAIAKAVAACLGIFVGMFLLGIFLCKAAIYSQVFGGIEVEKLFAANVAVTVLLSVLIMWCGKTGQIKKAAVLGGFGAMICGAVAYAVSCVVFAG